MKLPLTVSLCWYFETISKTDDGFVVFFVRVNFNIFWPDSRYGSLPTVYSTKWLYWYWVKTIRYLKILPWKFFPWLASYRLHSRVRRCHRNPRTVYIQPTINKEYLITAVQYRQKQLDGSFRLEEMVTSVKNFGGWFLRTTLCKTYHV